MLKLTADCQRCGLPAARDAQVQPKTVRQFGMLDGLFKKSEADVTETVYFDISIGGRSGRSASTATRGANHDLRAIDATPARRRGDSLVDVRTGDTTPKTCENFKQLCTGEKGLRLQGVALPPHHPRLHVPGRRLHERERHGRQERFTARSSPTRISTWSTADLGPYRWRTPGRTRTGASSSSASTTRPGSTASTSFARSSRARRLLGRWPPSGASPARRASRPDRGLGVLLGGC